MTSPRLLVPVRVPELGPSLGKVLTGTGRAPPDPVLDRYRMALVGRVLEASGEARRLAAEGERAPAVRALALEVWLEAWEHAVSGIARALVERVNAGLEAEARAVRMPRRLRRKVLLDAIEVRGLTGRLGASGATLVAALDELEQRAQRLIGASVAERAALEEWQRSLLLTARRLEAAWLALEDLCDEETARWREVADAVARWRRPQWPVLAVGVPVLLGAGWLGLVLGGYLDAPAWLRRVWSALPW
jgi:hypothetical protein